MTEPLTERDTRPRRPGRPRQVGPSDSYIERQAEIIAQSISVFGDRGYDAATLEDVAAALGTSRAGLYHYVTSKPHLLYLIFNKAITTTLATMDELARIADPETRLRALVAQQIHTIAANPAMFTVFFGDRPALGEEYEAEIVAKERRLLRYFIEAASDASAAGVLPDGDPRMVAQAILGMINWFHQWYDPQRDNPEEFVEVCLQLVLD